MYMSTLSYIFPTCFLHYKHVFVPKTKDFNHIARLKTLFCCRLLHVLSSKANHSEVIHGNDENKDFISIYK